MVLGAADPAVAHIGFEVKPVTDNYGTVRGYVESSVDK
jgi:hypothetical protein